MASLPTFNAGTDPTAAQWQTLLPLFAQKGADQSLTTTTAFQNDSALFLSVNSGAKYHYRLGLWIKAANASNGGMNVTWTLPSGASISWGIWVLGSTTTPGNPKTGLSVTGISLTTSPIYYGEEGILSVGANAGTFQFQWSQSTSNANASTVAAGSFLLLRQVA